ncbi:16777_t:CDS:1, partial [Gigaspora margarita]
TSKKDWKNYAMLFQRSLKECQDLKKLKVAKMNNNTEKKLDHLWDIIHNAIVKAANQTLSKKKI